MMIHMLCRHLNWFDEVEWHVPDLQSVLVVHLEARVGGLEHALVLHAVLSTHTHTERAAGQAEEASGSRTERSLALVLALMCARMHMRRACMIRTHLSQTRDHPRSSLFALAHRRLEVQTSVHATDVLGAAYAQHAGLVTASHVTTDLQTLAAQHVTQRIG